MKASRATPAHPPGPARLIAGLRARLAEAEATLRAIRLGEVDAVVVAGRRGPPQVFTLEGAEHAYRMLIESMNEGALTLTADKTILYANRCFARMVRCPLEQVIGGSFRRFLSPADRAVFRPLLRRAGQAGAKLRLNLQAGDGLPLPVQISIRPLAKIGGVRAPIGLVVTDLTEARRTEDLLRALTHRIVQVQELERGRLALQLHDRITQQLCAVLLSSQALQNSVAVRDGPARRESAKLHQLLQAAAAEVERISQDLRPSALDHLGLAAVLRDTGRKFARRTGLPVGFTGGRLPASLPPVTELALYRIFQEALNNVERHARARQVHVSLTRAGAFVQLTIKDDGRGLAPDRQPAGAKAMDALGLLGMRERATQAGGTLEIKSSRRAGTEIKASIPLPLGR